MLPYYAMSQGDHMRCVAKHAQNLVRGLALNSHKQFRRSNYLNFTTFLSKNLQLSTKQLSASNHCNCHGMVLATTKQLSRYGIGLVGTDQNWSEETEFCQFSSCCKRLIWRQQYGTRKRSRVQ